jgi:hypothetical protein
MTTQAAALSIIDALDDPVLFAPWFLGDTWWGWRVVLKAAFGLPLNDDELVFFSQVAERDPPGRRVRELWIVVGRRGGKDSIASVIAAYIAGMFSDPDQKLRPGERASVVCLATDRDQAKIILSYIRSYFTDIEMLAAMASNGDGTATSLELDNRVDISILTNSFRAVRGRAILAAVLDECAFWRDETSSNPDMEVYNALRPGLASLAESMLIGISSPYARNGLLYKKYRDHFGKDSSDVLVIRAPTRTLNPTIDQAIIDAAMADDPAAARAEWMAEFRDDVQAFVAREVVDAAVVGGRYELPRANGIAYVGFVDPSGGSADSMTVAIAHKEGDRAILDCVRERRPPFSPDDVVIEFAGVLQSYGIRSVRGDRYAGEWPRERFRSHGIQYEPCEKPKSDLYLTMLPMLNSGRVELLDIPRMISQLGSLERRTARSGKDSIDHAAAAHDDVANAVAGAIVTAFEQTGSEWMRHIPELIARVAATPPSRQFPGRRGAFLPPSNQTMPVWSLPQSKFQQH